VRLEPLPFRTRLGHGEVVDSWAPRHAMNNGTSVKDIDAILRRQRVVTSRSPRDPERAKAWRALGNLHERAFTEPRVVNGNWVIERSLCGRCMPHLEDGMGRLPWVGWVCLKHKRWIRGHEQTDLARFGEALVAERHWRGRLAPRGVVVDSPLLLLAEESATVGISKAAFEERAERVRHPSPGLLVYPETVSLARLLSRRSFLDAVLGDAPSPWKRALVEREVRSILPDALDAENWRALARVWDFVLSLQDVVRDARWLGQVPEDRWNVLRYWSGFAESERVEVVQSHPLV
jgi:hypothetical protein